MRERPVWCSRMEESTTLRCLETFWKIVRRRFMHFSVSVQYHIQCHLHCHVSCHIHCHILCPMQSPMWCHIGYDTGHPRSCCQLNYIIMFTGNLLHFTLKPMEVHQDMLCSSLLLQVTSDMDIVVQSSLLEPIFRPSTCVKSMNGFPEFVRVIPVMCKRSIVID